jgi:hypothetical protein
VKKHAVPDARNAVVAEVEHAQLGQVPEPLHGCNLVPGQVD